MTLLRSGTCPNCGAPIQFLLGSSVSKVCDHCAHIVVRTDRDLSTIGKIAELVPTAAPFEVGDEIRVSSRQARVAGRVQKDFGAGPWDELSIEFDGGEWAWLSRAQGRWYVTSRVDSPGYLPLRAEILSPGMQISFGNPGVEWTVMEVRTSRVLAARGEFPEPFAPDEVAHYADLVAAGDAFATLDYGDADGPATLYSGRVLPAETVALVRAAVGARPEHRVTTAKLKCTKCGAPIEIVDPLHVERVACAACGAVFAAGAVDATIALKHLATVPPLGTALTIPLGRQGKLRGVDVTVIGAMRRSTVVDGTRYDWLEYLLYSERGYLWLLEDNGHFTFVRDADATKVRRPGFEKLTYDGRAFKAFFRNVVHVHSVAGEFYWKVAAGDATLVEDFIAPPNVLSVEQTNEEVTYSMGEYVQPKEITDAFGALSLPTRHGVAAAQPGPDFRGPALAALIGVVLVALAAMMFGRSNKDLGAWRLPVRSSAPPIAPLYGDPPAVPVAPVEDTSNTTVSPPFVIDHMTTLSVRLGVPENNVSVSAECALVNETVGESREFAIDTGYYAGYSGGESWSEGSHVATTYLDRVAPGTYSLHVRTTYEGFSGDGAHFATDQYGAPIPPTPTMRVVANERSVFATLIALLLLLIPLVIAGVRAWLSNKARWENSNLISHGEE